MGCNSDAILLVHLLCVVIVVIHICKDWLWEAIYIILYVLWGDLFAVLF